MIVKTVNDTIKYNNLVFILLIFETYIHIINDDALNLFIIKRIKIINIAINKVAKLYIKR